MIEEQITIDEIRRCLYTFEDGGRCIKALGRTFVKIKHNSYFYEKKGEFKRENETSYTNDSDFVFEVWKLLNKDYYLQKEEFKRRSNETMYFLLQLFSDIEDGVQIDEVRDRIDDHLSSFSTMI